MLDDEYEMIAKLEAEALKRIQAARIALLEKRPFYGTLLSSLPLVADWTWLPTAATDHRRLFFNPEFIMGMPEERKKKVFARVDSDKSMTQQQKDEYKQHVDVFYRQKTMKEIVFVLMHEVRHITNDHCSRGKSFNSKKYNIAADHYINTSLVMEMGRAAENLKWFPDGRQTVFNKNAEFGFMAYGYCDFQYLGKTSEEIYALLPEGSKGKPIGTHISDCLPPGDPLGYNNPHPEPSPVEDDENKSWSKSMIETAMKVAGGEGPKEVRDLIAQWGKPKINYLQLIKQRMVSRVRSSLSYKKPSRRSGSVTQVLRNGGFISNRQSVVFPGRKKADTVDIVIGFDVSGSISKNTMNNIFNEIIGLSTLYKTFRITLFCWSTRVGNVCVYDHTNIRKILDYQVTSTGGTMASCAFEYIDENIPKAKDVIIFTDGFIEDLKDRQDWGRKYQTLWVICGGRSGWVSPFGKAVDLDEHTK